MALISPVRSLDVVTLRRELPCPRRTGQQGWMGRVATGQRSSLTADCRVLFASCVPIARLEEFFLIFKWLETKPQPPRLPGRQQFCRFSTQSAYDLCGAAKLCRRVRAGSFTAQRG